MNNQKFYVKIGDKMMWMNAEQMKKHRFGKKEEVKAECPDKECEDCVTKENVQKPNETEELTEKEILQEKLKAKGIKFHHFAGIDKLKQLLND